MYSHADHDGDPPRPVRPIPPDAAARERPDAPVSASVGVAAPEAGRRPGVPQLDRRVRVAIVGATGYVGSELVRILARHPHVEIVGLIARDRDRKSTRLNSSHVEISYA